MTLACTQEDFLRDVERHEIIVIRDDGVNRHIRFTQPNSGNMYFDLITWPGHLCYTSDMGTYVFRRLHDMFEFFSTDRRSDDKLYINLCYWTEKLIAVDGGRHGGRCEEFNEEKFRRVINEYRVEWMRKAKEEGLLDKDGRRELWEAVDDEVLSRLDDGGEIAKHAAYDFCHKNSCDKRKPFGWQFTDLFENNFNDYTHGMVWCCYALAWGIKTYEDLKKSMEVPA